MAETDKKENELSPTEKRMTLGEHLEDLRRRLIYAIIGLVIGMGISLFFGQQIIEVLKDPYVKVMEEFGLKPDLAVLDWTSSFTTYLKVSLICGVVVAAPWIFYQLWMFVSAGLYPRERRYVLFAVPFSAGLFVCGAAFFLFVMAPYVLRFLMGFTAWMGLTPVITLQSHIGFMTGMMLIFAVAFQTPLLVLLLVKMGAVSLKTFNKYRKHVIVAILIIAAIVTPPDPFSQIALALPLWLLYELGILLSLIFTRKA